MPRLSSNAIRTLRQIKNSWLQQRPGHAGQPTGGASIATGRRMRILTVRPDYLKCRYLTDTTQGPIDVYVAKPWSLRVTGWDGKTRDGISYSDYTDDGQQRTATDGTTTEIHLVTPPYVAAAGSWPGDEIVAVPAETTLTDPDGQPITLVDANVDGRAWAWEEPPP